MKHNIIIRDLKNLAIIVLYIIVSLIIIIFYLTIGIIMAFLMSIKKYWWKDFKRIFDYKGFLKTLNN